MSSMEIAAIAAGGLVAALVPVMLGVFIGYLAWGRTAKAAARKPLQMYAPTEEQMADIEKRLATYVDNVSANLPKPEFTGGERDYADNTPF